MDPLQFNWVVSQPHIKEENGELGPSLLSPPTTPSSSFTLSSSSPGPPPRVLRTNLPSPPTSGRIRPRPYPPTKPAVKKDSDSVSQSLQRMQWGTTSGGTRRSISSSDRRASDADRSTAYGNNTMDAFMMPAPDSSLLGAIGGTSDPQYARVSPLYSNSNMAWNEMPMMTGNTETPYPTGVPGHSNMFPSLSTPSGYENVDMARNASPESMGPNSPSYYPQVSDGYMMVGGRPYRALSSSSSGSQSPYQREDPESEIRRLRKKIKDLQQALLETRAAASSGPSGLANPSSSFRATWKRRTDARKKMFCSLNRAGNALCAWHDSRRERRQYPPRNAPQGMLNCGCTHEEALFEESLARHHVGGYHPGESVRMDPDLRRPLLKLLQERYGYKDGDFDYDPQTMEWYPEQDADSWERQVHSGSSARTRRPDHSDRH